MIVTFPCPSCGGSIEAERTGLKRRTTQCPHCEETAQVPDDLPVGPGVVIGNGYRLNSKAGDSSLGEIFYATDAAGGSFVVEVLAGNTGDDQEKITRLIQEFELVASMDHPHIQKAVEAGQDSGTYFLVTEHQPGMTLEEYLSEKAPLPEQEAFTLCTGVAEALKYAWETQQVLHRDIKPQNVYVSEEGEALLTGFGIAKTTQGQSLGLTGVGFTIGTPEYMSPEQIKADENLDFRSDMYSFGVMLYECLVGDLPFREAAPILLMQKHMDEMPEPVNARNPQVSKKASDIVDRLLAKTPDERFGNWDECIHALRAVCGGEPEPAPKAAKAAPKASAKEKGTATTPTGFTPPQEAEEGSKGIDKNTLILAGIVGVVVIIVVIILAIMFRPA